MKGYLTDLSELYRRSLGNEEVMKQNVLVSVYEEGVCTRQCHVDDRIVECLHMKHAGGI